jgi:hypothetical protein
VSKRWAVVLAVAIVLLSSAPAWAGSWHRGDRDDRRSSHHDRYDRHHGHSGYDSDDDGDWDDSDSDSDSDDGDDDWSSDDSDDDTDISVLPDVAPAAGSITAELTGYSWQDNTPPGSADISMPVIHQKADGTGTYSDPITTAVPGSGGKGAETPKGTKIYVPKIKRYIIVEDTGATKMSSKHFDIWVGGEGFSKSASDKCMNSFTGKAQVEINPPAGRPVTVGALTNASGCKI